MTPSLTLFEKLPVNVEKSSFLNFKEVFVLVYVDKLKIWIFPPIMYISSILKLKGPD